MGAVKAFRCFLVWLRASSSCLHRNKCSCKNIVRLSLLHLLFGQMLLSFLGILWVSERFTVSDLETDIASPSLFQNSLCLCHVVFTYLLCETVGGESCRVLSRLKGRCNIRNCQHCPFSSTSLNEGSGSKMDQGSRSKQGETSGLPTSPAHQQHESILPGHLQPKVTHILIC